MASVEFLDSRLVIIHIPLELLHLVIGAVIQVLSLVGQGTQENGQPRRPYAFPHPFGNISITTQEASVICPREVATAFFTPVLADLKPDVAQRISISREEYLALTVGAQDMEAGQRVLNITAPLAIAGISLFYITSYFSDFVLVPQKARATVIQTLQTQGFVFQRMFGQENQMTSMSTPTLAQHGFVPFAPPPVPASPVHGRGGSSSSAIDIPTRSRGRATTRAQTPSPPPVKTPDPAPPAAAAATSIADWQTRTFASLNAAGIVPVMDTSLKLVSAAAHRSDDRNLAARLHSYLVSCLLATTKPRFLCLTLSDTDSVSVTLDRELMPRFFKGNILLTSDEITVPIMLDLRELPDDCTGIVCGVAGRLLDRMAASSGGVIGPGFSMSYLSTAKGGNVIVREDEVDDALEALKDIGIER